MTSAMITIRLLQLLERRRKTNREFSHKHRLLGSDLVFPQTEEVSAIFGGVVGSVGVGSW